MIDVTEFAGTVFSGLSSLVIEDVEDAGEAICVRARTRHGAVACPGCGTETARVHEYRERTAADVPVDGRRVLVKVKVRRMRCAALDCAVQTFREQVPGVLDRYQRRTTRLTGQVSAVARELAGRAPARLLPALGMTASRHTALRVLLRIPLPALAVPRVPGIDDFALRRGSVYATVLTDAGTGQRVDVVQGRTADVAEKWLRDHPGAEVVCRDGSGAYGEAVRQALPDAVQVSDRWHLWHGLGEAVRKEVAAHSACWAGGMPLQEGKRAATTLERWQQVRELRARNVGLPECARRLNLSLNTVKRYDRASEPERLQRVPKYRPTLVDPTAATSASAGPKSPASRSGSCCGRSASAATRAAPTSSSATSTRAAWTATGRTSHPGGPPGSCSPGRTASRPASTRRSPGSPPPALR